MCAHSLAAHGRTKQALASLVQFGEDDVLGLVGCRLRREVDHDRLVRLLGQPIQNEILPHHRDFSNRVNIHPHSHKQHRVISTLDLFVY